MQLVRSIQINVIWLCKTEHVRKLLPQLTPDQILKLDREIHEYLETHMMMSVAQTAFSEWNDKEEDIYSDVSIASTEVEPQ